MSNEIKELKEEIEDLEWTFADMLKTALFLAGVKDENLQDAFKSYLQAFDKMFDDEEAEIGYRDNVAVIDYLKQHEPDLFS